MQVTETHEGDAKLTCLSDDQGKQFGVICEVSPGVFRLTLDGWFWSNGTGNRISGEKWLEVPTKALALVAAERVVRKTRGLTLDDTIRHLIAMREAYGGDAPVVFPSSMVEGGYEAVLSIPLTAVEVVTGYALYRVADDAAREDPDVVTGPAISLW